MLASEIGRVCSGNTVDTLLICLGLVLDKQPSPVLRILCQVGTVTCYRCWATTRSNTRNDFLSLPNDSVQDSGFDKKSMLPPKLSSSLQETITQEKETSANTCVVFPQNVISETQSSILRISILIESIFPAFQTRQQHSCFWRQDPSSARSYSDSAEGVRSFQDGSRGDNFWRE